MITDLDLLIAANNAYHTTSTLVVKDIHVVLSEKDNTTIVAFRGTEITNLEDDIRDISACATTSKEYEDMGHCHHGFLTGALSIFPQLKDLLQNKTIHITGHSLGGALAVATAGLCVISGLKPIGLTTFGAPSAGFEHLQKLIHKIPGTRWVDSNDPVPLVSPYMHDRPKTSIGKDRLDPIDSHLIETGYKPDLMEYLDQRKGS